MSVPTADDIADGLTIPEADAKAICRYVDKLVDLLLLMPYKVVLITDELIDANLNMVTASIHPTPEYWTADLRIDARYAEFPADELRMTLCHELCHLMFANTGRLLLGGLHLTHGTASIEWAECEARIHHESEIERLSRVLAPSLPLPRMKLQGAQQKDES